MERPTQTYSVGESVMSVYHDEQGEVKAVDWSVTFGCWTYKLLRARDSRYGGVAGTEVWVCESDLRRLS